MVKDKMITIENCWLCPVIETDILPLFCDVIIDNGIIIKIRVKNFQTYLKNPSRVNKNSLNAGGRVVTLPMVNFHDHIYSRLSTGLPLKGKFDSFLNILHNLWWKLDKALDNDMTAASAKSAAIDSIKNGVTYIFDHHSSQNSIDGSLNIIRAVLERFNLRGVLAFECTDRNGSKNALKGLEENKNFLTSLQSDNFYAMLGLHASFTLSDETLLEALNLKKSYNLGIHIHVAEDKADIKLSSEYTKYKPVKRLVKYHLINDKSILVHGVHLKQRDFQYIEENEGALAFCLDSNMNNNVGLLPLQIIPPGISLLAGTDGMSSNIAGSLKQLYLTARSQGFSFDKAVALIKKVYFDQLVFVKKYFTDFPNLHEKERADLIIWDYVPSAPLSRDNFWGHYIYGMLESRIHSVVQNGVFLMKEFNLLNCDENQIKSEIVFQGERLFKEFSR